MDKIPFIIAIILVGVMIYLQVISKNLEDTVVQNTIEINKKDKTIDSLKTELFELSDYYAERWNKEPFGTSVVVKIITPDGNYHMRRVFKKDTGYMVIPNLGHVIIEVE